MGLTSSEKYLLEKQLRRLNSKVCLLKEEDQDIQAQLDLKADLVGGVVPTDQLPIDQNTIDALNNANAPTGTNYFTTLADLSSITPGTLINVVSNYSALPAANTVPGEFYWVENPQGTSWLPGPLGGTYYTNGLYYSNSTSWVYTDMPYNATQIEVDAGLNNNKFVTPLTFTNAAKWNTKVSSVTGPAVDNTDPLNPVIQLPTNLTFYSTTAASDIVGYNRLVIDITDPDYDSPAVDVSTGSITTTAQPVGVLVADAGVFAGNPGIINISTVGEIRRVSGSGTAEFYYEVYLRDSLGVETLVATSNVTPAITGATYEQFSASALLNNGTWTVTDRVVIKYFANRIPGASDPTYEFNFGGSSPVRTLFPISASLLLNVPVSIGITGVTGGTPGSALIVDPSGLLGQVSNPVTGTGASGQVSYWTGTGTQGGSNNLFWDAANGRLGIGTNTPSSKLFIFTSSTSSVVGNNNALILHNDNPNWASSGLNNLTEFFFSDAGQASGTSFAYDIGHRYAGISGYITGWNTTNSSGGLNFVTKETTGAVLSTKMQIRPNGNLLINTTTDNGTDKLQVNGGVAFGTAFKWDNVNGRLGIGTNTPVGGLHVVRSSFPNSRFDRIAPNGTAYIYAVNSLNVITTGVLSSGFGGVFVFGIQGDTGILNEIADIGAIKEGEDNSGSLIFRTSNSGTRTEKIRILKTGQVGINTQTPSARIHVVGSGTTSSTTALLVQDSASVKLFEILDNGDVRFRNNSLTFYQGSTGNIRTSRIDALTNGQGITIAGGTSNVILNTISLTQAGTTSRIENNNHVNITRLYDPASGTGVYNLLYIDPTINQTGGANGITRGLYVNPTLTSAADWRSIETSNNTGYAIYAAGTANSYFGGNVGVGTNAPSVTLDVVKTGTSFTIARFLQNIDYPLIYVGRNTSRYVQMTWDDPLGEGLFQTASRLYPITFDGSATKFMTTGVVRARIFENTGNFLLQNGGTFTDNGQRLQVYGSTLLRGSGTTSATTALLVQNSTPTELFKVADDGRISQTLPNSSGSTAFGTGTLSAITTGINNTAFGFESMLSATNASTCVSIGYRALRANTSGQQNVAIGGDSMRVNTTGGSNTAVGANSLTSNTTAYDVVAIGNSALRVNTTGGSNTAVGAFSLGANTTGANNTAFGYFSGRYAGSGTTANETSSNSIYVGYQSRSGATGSTNQIVIGYDVVGNGSNTTTLGNTSTTDNYIYGNFNIIDKNLVFGTTTGTKIGTATNQKLSFWNATPVVQQTGDIPTALSNLGLVTSPTLNYSDIYVTTNRQTASYTLALSDAGKLVEMNVATANDLTVPLDSSVAFPIGTKIDIIQYGAGQTTVVATGGVTIRSANNWVKINAQYGAATLVKVGTDEWYLFGNLNA